jgi:hypothetical protein
MRETGVPDSSHLSPPRKRDLRIAKRLGICIKPSTTEQCLE